MVKAMEKHTERQEKLKNIDDQIQEKIKLQTEINIEKNRQKIGIDAQGNRVGDT